MKPHNFSFITAWIREEGLTFEQRRDLYFLSQTAETEREAQDEKRKVLDLD